MLHLTTVGERIQFLMILEDLEYEPLIEDAVVVEENVVVVVVVVGVV